MVVQLITSLVDSEQNYYRVRNFLLVVTSLVFIFIVFTAFSGFGRWMLITIMGVKGQILEESIKIIRIFVLIPLFVTLKNFYQAFAIKFQKGYLIILGTVFRIIFTLIVLFYIKDILNYMSAAVIAGVLFAGSAGIEAIIMFISTRISLKDIKVKLNHLKEKYQIRSVTLNQAIIFQFFWPLLIAFLLRSTARPVVNMGLARSVSPELALSAYSVAWGLGMIIISPLNLFRQIPINYIDQENTNFQTVMRFTISTGLVLTGGMVILSFTGLGSYILTNWIGVTEEITGLSLDVLKLMVLLPFIMAAREFCWGFLMKKRQTGYIARGKIINIVILIITIMLMTLIDLKNPAIIGAIGMILCQLAEFIYLFLRTRRIYEAGNILEKGSVDISS